jgi:hypothetical protein
MLTRFLVCCGDHIRREASTRRPSGRPRRVCSTVSVIATGEHGLDWGGQVTGGGQSMSFSSLFCGRVNRECPNLNEVKGKVVPEPERSEEEGCPAEENHLFAYFIQQSRSI